MNQQIQETYEISRQISLLSQEHGKIYQKYEEEIARLAREHNDANVICFGSGFIDRELAIKCVDIFANTKADERHLARIRKIDAI